MMYIIQRFEELYTNKMTAHFILYNRFTKAMNAENNFIQIHKCQIPLSTEYVGVADNITPVDILHEQYKSSIYEYYFNNENYIH